MTKNNRFPPAFEKGHFNGLVDEGKYLRQSLLYKQILPRPVRRSFNEGGTPSRPKTSVPSVAKNPFNQRNPRLMKYLRAFGISTTVECALQNHLFMQNKPNFPKSQMNVTVFITKDYGKMDTWSSGKKQSQTNPNKANTNPIQSQFKPKQTQLLLSQTAKFTQCAINELRTMNNELITNKPNLSCRSLWRSRIKPNFTTAQKGRKEKLTIDKCLTMSENLNGAVKFVIMS